MASHSCGTCGKTFASQAIRDAHITAVHTIARTTPQPRKPQGDPGQPRGDGGTS